MPTSLKIPVGVTSVLGYVLTALQLAAAVVLYVSGDHAAAAEAMGGGTLTHLVTAGGRYAQAHGLTQLAKTAEDILPTLQQELVAPPTPGA